MFSKTPRDVSCIDPGKKTFATLGRTSTPWELNDEILRTNPVRAGM